MAPQITTIEPSYWTAAIDWVHNATCFEHCDFVVEWETFSATTKATTIYIDRLKPGKHYKVNVTAQCMIVTRSLELHLNSTGTRKFKTKGMPPIITVFLQFGQVYDLYAYFMYTDGPIILSLTSANNTSVACAGKTFVLKCSHPPLDVIGSTGEYIFASTLPTWEINGEVITLDGSLFRATYLSETESLLEVSFGNFPSFSLSQTFTFTCAVHLHNHTVLNSKEFSIHVTGKKL